MVSKKAQKEKRELEEAQLSNQALMAKLEEALESATLSKDAAEVAQATAEEAREEAGQGEGPRAEQ